MRHRPRNVRFGRTVLTHFSPRYQKIAEIHAVRNHTTKTTRLLPDHMRLKLSYFEWAHVFLDLYQRLFTNDDSEGNKTSQRRIKYGEERN